MKATVQVHWLATTQYVYRVTRVRDLTGEHIIVTMIRHESLVEKHYMSTFQRLASGLAFPEGPIALSDGSLLIVEMFGPYLTRIHANGRVERICAVPGGPNGIAMGPDGRVYVCNNGAAFSGYTAITTGIYGIPTSPPIAEGRFKPSISRHVPLRHSTRKAMVSHCRPRTTSSLMRTAAFISPISAICMIPASVPVSTMQVHTAMRCALWWAASRLMA